jgi:hypothetical protein
MFRRKSFFRANSTLWFLVLKSEDTNQRFSDDQQHRLPIYKNERQELSVANLGCTASRVIGISAGLNDDQTSPTSKCADISGYPKRSAKAWLVQCH